MTSSRGSMHVSIVIATYGGDDWMQLARQRAYPSAMNQEADQILLYHALGVEIAEARNSAAREATGGWLCFLDADDELAPGYLEAMLRAYEQRGRSGVDPSTPDGTPPLLTPAVSYVRKGKAAPPKFNDRGVPLTDDNWLVVGTLVRKDLFMEVGGFSDYPHGFEDFSLWSKCWRAGAEIIKVPDAVYLAHVNPRSKHRQGWRNRKWQVETHQRVVRELDEWEAARA